MLKKKVQHFDLAPVEWKRPGIQLDSLRCVGVLGQGSYGVVKLVEDSTKTPYALKVVSKQRVVEAKQKDHVFNEKTLLALLDHPMIVKLYNVYQDANCLFFLMEPVLGGELFGLLRRQKKFPPDQARFYASSVVLALEHIQKQNFIYRDLKPENLLLDSTGYMKFVDFGFVKKVRCMVGVW